MLYLSQARGSFAVAGLVSGALALGAAVGAPVQSRLIDRKGQRAVLLPVGLGHAAAVAGLIGLTEIGAPAAALAVLGLATGFTESNVGSVMRALWPELLADREDLVPAAFALDSVSVELLFTLGPLITAVVVALVSPAAALVLAAALGVAGTLAFIGRPPSRRWRPHPDAGTHGVLGALRSGGVQTLAIATVPVGFGFGTIEIMLPAFARRARRARARRHPAGDVGAGQRDRRAALRRAPLGPAAPHLPLPRLPAPAGVPAAARGAEHPASWRCSSCPPGSASRR